MKILNKTTGRFYKFTTDKGIPVWSEPHRPSQATKVTVDEAAKIVKQLLYHEPSLDIHIVE